MNIDKFKTIAKHLHDYRIDIRDDKLYSYASDENVLEFFEKQAQVAGCTPYEVWKIMVAKQLVAVYNYMDGKDLDPSEPMINRFSDLMNYMELGYALTENNDDTQTETESCGV